MGDCLNGWRKLTTEPACCGDRYWDEALLAWLPVTPGWPGYAVSPETFGVEVIRRD